jgi:HSP20 family protein
MYFIKVRLDRNIRGLHGRMQHLMGEIMNLNRPLHYSSKSGWIPEADMFETEHEVFLMVNLAGVRRDDIEVSCDENYLRVGGKRIQTIPAGMPARYHQLEIGHGQFERIFRLPAMIDKEQVEAGYEDGLLAVKMKKLREPGRIYVKVRP